MFENGVEERGDVGGVVGLLEFGKGGEGGRIEDREVELLVCWS